MKIMVPHHTQTVSVLEKFCPTITLASCVILDESILRQLEVNFKAIYLLLSGERGGGGRGTAHVLLPCFDPNNLS